MGNTDVSRIAGPLVVVEAAEALAYGDLVDVLSGQGPPRRGQVLEAAAGRAVVQVFGGTSGLGRTDTTVLSRGRSAHTGVGRDYLGRILDGAGRPRDGGPEPLADEERDVNGLPLNPMVRDHPDEFIETGISAIDGLNTLVRGQKLPIFSGYGLPANELAARIATQARVRVPGGNDQDRTEDNFVVVFAAMGVTRREAEFFQSRFLAGDAARRTVVLLNLADDPTIERILTPRVALTLAEYFAFDLGLHVLTVLTDVTAYAEALREIAAAREEMPGRRGYPGYMYTDLASLFERAGRVRGRPGSLTQLMILSMPDDDITHPVPDLTGYITEGQIVLSRELDRAGIDPPIDVLPSLSRLMNSGIGAGRTREDHRGLADQLYACYARGKEVRRLLSIVGESALPAEDRRYLALADAFEREFVGQAGERRSLEQTLDAGWRLLTDFPDGELKRLKPEFIARYRKGGSTP
ncbi:MAG: V-type ATP synthase subunit B [Kineosporiaceae bacterium]|nr:V-type ATP synthase subunit B [Kineosporiaceae bacterium]